MMEKTSWMGGIFGIFALSAGFILHSYQKYTTWSWVLIGVGLALFLFFVIVNYKLISALFAGRRARYGANAVFITIVTAALVVICHLLAMAHNKRFDTTENKRFTLATQSVKIVQSLSQPVKAYVFSIEGEPGFDKLEDLMQMYSNAGKLFSYEFIDPNRNPALSKKYAITKYDTTVLEMGETTKKVNSPDEQEFTNALVALTEGTKKIIYFLTGHNEANFETTELEGLSDAKNALEQDNYEVKNILLLREEKVPTDCAVLVIAGPQEKLYDEELLKITNYINGGGAALFLVDTDAPDQLLDYLKGFGFIIGKDIVVDQLTQIFGGDYFMPMAVAYEPHAITDNFQLNPAFPLVRSVSPNPEAGERIKAQKLFFSSPESWAETDLKTIQGGGEIQYDKDVDTIGPVPLACAAEIQLTAADLETKAPDTEIEANETNEADSEAEPEVRTTRLVTVGDVDFARNRHFNLPGNNDIFLNIVSWLSEEESLIAIRPKKAEVEPVMLNALQSKFVFLIPVLFLPGVIAAYGIITLSQRRRYR